MWVFPSYFIWSCISSKLHMRSLYSVIQSVCNFRWRHYFWFARKQWKNFYIWCALGHCWQVHSKQDSNWWPTIWFESRWRDCSNNSNYNELHSFVTIKYKNCKFKYPSAEILSKQWFMLQYWCSTKIILGMTHCTGSLKVKRMAQVWLLRKEDVDYHYVSAIYLFLIYWFISLRDDGIKHGDGKPFCARKDSTSSIFVYRWWQS